MFVDYWYSEAARAWLVADKTGTLLAQFKNKLSITDNFMPEVIVHVTEQCDCSDCEDTRDDVAIDDGHHSIQQLGEDVDFREGGYGDSFR